MKKRIFLLILAFILTSSLAQAAIYDGSRLDVLFLAVTTGARSVPLPATHTETNRYTCEIKVTLPDSSNAITWTFEIVDDQGITRYSLAGLSRDTEYIFLIKRFVKAGYSYRLTPSGAPGSIVTIFIDPTYFD